MVQVTDYVDIRDSLKSILESVNTTTATYDLSLNLPKRVKTVTTDDLEIFPRGITEYPLISVRLEGKTESFDSIGGAPARIVTINTSIYCIYDDQDGAEDNLWNMVRNVETNLRSEVDLNNYSLGGMDVMWAIPSTVNFKEGFEGVDSAVNKSAVIDFDITGRVKDV